MHRMSLTGSWHGPVRDLQTADERRTDGRRADERRAGRQRVDQKRTLSPNAPGRSRWPHSAVAIAGVLVLAISFGISVLLIQPQPATTPAMTALARSTITDLGTLMAAVKSAGLKGSPDIKGAIEEIVRRDGEHVALKGWVADAAGRDPSLAVMAFVDGRSQRTVQTRGGRPDVTAALGLHELASADMSFALDLTCNTGHALILVAVAQSDRYAHFGARRCP